MEFEKKDTVFTPVEIIEIIYYTPDEYKLFIQDVCFKTGLMTLKTVIENFQYDDLHIREYIQAVAEGKSYFKGVSLDVVTEGQKKHHQELIKLMYATPLKDLPLYVNTDEDYIDIVRWRFKLGK